jgi:hypothetical protein
MANCMGCVKMNELTSLRAAKKRFESGKEVIRLKEALEKEQRRNAELTESLNKIRAELGKQRTGHDFYQDRYETLNDQYEVLVQKYLNLQNTISDHEFMNAERLRKAIDALVLGLMGELEEKDGMITKLKAQINRDFRTSSSPSSQFPNRAPIQNSREKTGRKQGGQRGHKGHPRKQLETTEPIVDLSFPDEVMNNPENYEYSGTIVNEFEN